MASTEERAILHTQRTVTSICSELGLPVEQRPEWVYENPESGYRVEFSVVDGSILVSQPHGYATLDELRHGLDVLSATATQAFGASRPFVLVEDFTDVAGSSLEGRRFYIQRMRKEQQRILALVFCAASPLMQLSIKLGRRLNMVQHEVELVDTLEEAFAYARKLGTGKRSGTPPMSSGYVVEFRSRSDGRTCEVATSTNWCFQTDNYSSSQEVIDGRILHVISSGHLRQEHIAPLEAARERVRLDMRSGRGFDYMIADLKGVTGITRQARRMYVDSIRRWHQKWPLRMYVFCAGNQFLRAAVNLARPFVPFKVRIAEDCEHAMQLIEHDAAGTTDLAELPVAPGLESPNVDPELLRPYVHELLTYLGSLDWESRGIRQEPDIDPNHPFAPVFESIALIKDEVDDLLTERRRAEDQRAELEVKLQRAEKMEAIGTLAGGVAHDLNNILAGLVTYPDLLLLKLPQDSPLREPIEKIRASGERAATIVQDMLTLARRGIATRHPVDLNRVVSDYLTSPEHRQILTEHPNVRMVVQLADSLPKTTGSPVHLGKSVMNLVSNAVEAMPEGGTLTVATDYCTLDEALPGYEVVEAGEYLTVVVTDTGVGIAADDLDRIFEPFYTKKVMGRSGTGLGMSLVWGTIKDHRGYIDVTSSEGHGTTFTLFIPVIRAAAEEGRSRVPLSRLRGQGETILLVEDMPEQREIAGEMLKSLGYRVTAVASGEEAVEHLRTSPANLVILDMIMDPGIDGLETYRRILDIHPAQRAIIASGYSETERVKEAKRLGVGAYVRKPYLLEEIGLAIRQELDR